MLNTLSALAQVISALNVYGGSLEKTLNKPDRWRLPSLRIVAYKLSPGSCFVQKIRLQPFNAS